MIISHKYKFIFVKTRKTAGTSIEIALSRFCGDDDIITPISPEDEEIRKELKGSGPQNCFLPLKKYTVMDWFRFLMSDKKPLLFYNHIPASEIRKRVSEEVWNTYFKFCFERNPWDKTISYYYRRTRESQPRPSLFKCLSSEDFPKLSDFEKYTIDGEIVMDYVARYENIEHDIQYITNRLGLPSNIQLPMAKSGFRKDKRHYKEIINSEERKKIAEIFKREISYFDFEF